MKILLKKAGRRVEMFGNDDDNNQTTDPAATAPVVGDASTPPAAEPSTPPTNAPTVGASSDISDSTAYGGSTDSGSVSSPPADSATDSKPDDSSDSNDFIATNAPNDDEHPMPVGGTTDDLISMKQQALQQLSPLVDHLDQSPEEKFRTTMMMIQASDDQSLIKTAYDAAQKIMDEKTRAQALLDIVNEINYFTQQAQK